MENENIRGRNIIEDKNNQRKHSSNIKNNDVANASRPNNVAKNTLSNNFNDSSSFTGGLINPANNLLGSGRATGMSGGAANITNKVFKLEKAFANTTVRSSIASAGTSGDAGKGFSVVCDASRVGLAVAKGSYLRIQDAALKGELKSAYNIFSKDDLKNSLNEINQVLSKYGVKPINPNLSGPQLRKEAERLLRKLHKKGIKIPELDKALKKACKLGMYSPGKRTNLKRIRMMSTQKIMRSLKKCEAGQGLSLATTITRRGAKIVKKTIKLTRSVSNTLRIAGLKAALASAKLARKAALKVSNTKYGIKIKSKVSNKLNSSKNYKRITRKRKVSKSKQKIRKGKNRFKRAREKIRNKFSIKKKLKKRLSKIVFKNPIARRISNSFIMKALRMPFKILAKIMAVISSVFSFIFGFILIALLLVIIVLIIICAIVNLFNFGASEEEIRDAAMKQIGECYQQDLEDIGSLINKYPGGVTIKYEDVKNKKEYKKRKKGEKQQPFYQTTNNAEILSMALTRFDYDFKEAGESDVLDYVKQLYYGSHEIIIKESDAGKDKNGKKIKSAVVTYRTYYFDYIFERQLLEERQDIVNNDDTSVYLTGKNIKDSIYVALRDHGYSHEVACAIMANIDRESSFNPKDENQYGYYGLFQWGGGRLNNLKKYCAEKGYAYMSVEGQMAFFFKEIADSYSKLEDFLKDSKDLMLSTQEFCVGYEGCVGSTKGKDDVYTGSLYPSAKGKTYQLLGARYDCAKEYDKKYSKYKKNYEKLRGSIGEQVSSLGLKYIGKLHYVWGGKDLATGCDCSGFVFALYQKYGVSVPSSSGGFISDTSHKVLDKLDYSKMKPGDVIVETSTASGSGRHVTLYVGNKKVIGSNGNNAGCPQQGASPGGTPLKKQKCPNDCGYTHPGNILGIYRYAK